jgi:hypothetical protein
MAAALGGAEAGVHQPSRYALRLGKPLEAAAPKPWAKKAGAPAPDQFQPLDAASAAASLVGRAIRPFWVMRTS